MTKKKILGFDVSSSTIGYGLLSVDDVTKEIVYLQSGFIKPPKGDNILERLLKTKSLINSLLEKLKPDYIGIEKIVAFMPHRSSANTVITLAVFNHMVGLLSFEFLNSSPELFPVMQIRRGITPLGGTVPSKEEIADLVSKRLGIIFPYVFGKRGKVAVESLDVADGIAVALFYALLLTDNINKSPKSPPKKPKIKNKRKIKK